MKNKNLEAMIGKQFLSVGKITFTVEFVDYYYNTRRKKWVVILLPLDDITKDGHILYDETDGGINQKYKVGCFGLSLSVFLSVYIEKI